MNHKNTDYKVLLIANCARNIIWFRKQLITQLAKRGFEVHVAVEQDEVYDQLILLPCTVHKLGNHTNRVSILSEFKYIYKLQKILAQVRPDIIHTFTIRPNMYAPLIARTLGLKNIFCMITGQSRIFVDRKFIYRVASVVAKFTYRLSFSVAKIVYVVNSDDKNFAESILKNKSTVNQIYGAGVDLNHFTPKSPPSSEDHNNDTDGNMKFLYLGRMIKEKGVLELIEAFKQLNGYPLQLRLVGPMNKEDIDVKKMVSNSENVIFSGESADALNEYESADIIILPTYREGMPTVVMESMAMGKIVMASDVPGCSDIIKHLKNGVLFESKNVDSIVESIKMVLENPALRNSIAIEAFRCRNDYSKDKVVNTIIKNYVEFL